MFEIRNSLGYYSIYKVVILILDNQQYAEKLQRLNVRMAEYNVLRLAMARLLL